MNAPAIHAPSSHVVFACGDCAGKILTAGGDYAPGVRELPYGQLCDVHPAGKLDRAATNALVPPEGWTREPTPSVDALSGVNEDGVPLPTTMGPLTEITARLVVAWSAVDRASIDLATVQTAALVAEMILKSTNGA